MLEKNKHLKDNAFTGKFGYFKNFYSDIKSHRFALIVNEPLLLKQWNITKRLSEENDTWTELVSEHVLKYYKVLETFPEVGVQLLVPINPGTTARPEE